ncbi:unnamed protein product [Nesidiocoris tenuis]|uniref:Uncharacterized protein n=1 Tax=Nesidiocoris tenuis TaxID=355587 RepID=A0A6H5HM25_9HEMI|nr:unnamed protein product [Nesidiocoris tenuis]
MRDKLNWLRLTSRFSTKLIIGCPFCSFSQASQTEKGLITLNLGEAQVKVKGHLCGSAIYDTRPLASYFDIVPTESRGSRIHSRRMATRRPKDVANTKTDCSRSTGKTLKPNDVQHSEVERFAIGMKGNQITDPDSFSSYIIQGSLNNSFSKHSSRRRQPQIRTLMSTRLENVHSSCTNANIAEGFDCSSRCRRCSHLSTEEA